MTTTHYQCDCGWTGTDDDFDLKCEFYGSREEPPEYSAWCPSCGKDAELIDEATWCRGCEDVIVNDENELCDDCYMESVADQEQRWAEEHGIDKD